MKKGVRYRWYLWLAARADARGERLLAESYRAIADGRLSSYWEA